MGVGIWGQTRNFTVGLGGLSPPDSHNFSERTNSQLSMVQTACLSPFSGAVFSQSETVFPVTGHQPPLTHGQTRPIEQQRSSFEL